MFSFLKKEKWQHLKTEQVDQLSYSEDGRMKQKDVIVYVHFYESSKNNRKIELACSLPDANNMMVDNYIKSTDLYHTRILRWLNGRLDPEIPRYNQIGEEDTANMLRGKV